MKFPAFSKKHAEYVREILMNVVLDKIGNPACIIFFALSKKLMRFF